MSTPKTVTTKLYILKDLSSDWISVSTSSMENLGYITIGTKEVTLEVPSEVDIEKETARVLQIREQRLKLKEDYETALSSLR